MLGTPTQYYYISLLILAIQCIEKEYEQWLTVKNFLIQIPQF